MGAFDHPALDEIHEVLGEEGWWPSDQPPHPDESVVMINIDDAADKIVNALSRRGYLRWDNVR